MSTDRYPDALADEVRERRTELGLTQADLASRTERLDPKNKGISYRTVSDIESCTRNNLRAHTLAMLDSGLEWPRGTAYAIFHGEDRPDAQSLDLDGARRLRALESRMERIESTLNVLVDYVESSARLGQLRQVIDETREPNNGTL